MKVLIMGCGRVGAYLAGMLDKEGHAVTVLDTDAYSFRRLPPNFGGTTVVGDGIDDDVLRAAGLGEMDAFVAVTQGDNRNVMAAQIAKQAFGVPKVLCRIYDPMREQMYHEMGLETMSPTKTVAAILRESILK